MSKKETNYIDDIVEEFRKNGGFDHISLDDACEWLKQKLQEVEQKTKQEIIEKIERFKIPENAKVINGKDINLKSFQNNLVDIIIEIFK